ncbi:MAG: hypothetical protein WC044_06425 [Crocinitomicaceae bacterium]
MENDRLFFPHEEGDDWEERYEELLFEDKQFFTTRVIVPKVFRARLEKIKKREAAFRRLSGIIPREPLPKSECQIATTEYLKSIYLSFQKDKAVLFQQLYLAQECATVVFLIEKLLEYFLRYATNWKLSTLNDTNEILLSKELDPSELYSALSAFDQAGGESVNEIETLFFEGKNQLLTEAKRLSLLLQNEME